MKTTWKFSIFTMIMAMAVAFADTTHKTSSMIPASDDSKKEQKEKRLYMVVDLTKNGKMAVSYLDAVPKVGWSDEYKTKKMVLRKIAPGSFEYRPGKSFKITKPFYIGVFEVTQKQYEMIMNMKKKAPQHHKAGDMLHPVQNVSWHDIRGSNKGLNWPKDGAVDSNSYLGKLRKKVGMDFDLPTEVQWEYACRAGTKGDFNVDGVEMVKLGKYRGNNKAQTDTHVKVGSYMPNAWGLYDMHGNVWEWCADRGKDEWNYDPFDWKAESKETETDPKGPAIGKSRFLRGGSWKVNANDCRSSIRIRRLTECKSNSVGFRLACPAGAQ